MKCKFCGHENKEDSLLCDACNKPLNPDVIIDDESKNNQNTYDVPTMEKSTNNGGDSGTMAKAVFQEIPPQNIPISTNNNAIGQEPLQNEDGMPYHLPNETKDFYNELSKIEKNPNIPAVSENTENINTITENAGQQNPNLVPSIPEEATKGFIKPADEKGLKVKFKNPFANKDKKTKNLLYVITGLSVALLILIIILISTSSSRKKNQVSDLYKDLYGEGPSYSLTTEVGAFDVIEYETKEIAFSDDITIVTTENNPKEKVILLPVWLKNTDNISTSVYNLLSYNVYDPNGIELTIRNHYGVDSIYTVGSLRPNAELVTNIIVEFVGEGDYVIEIYDIETGERYEYTFYVPSE